MQTCHRSKHQTDKLNLEIVDLRYIKSLKRFFPLQAYNKKNAGLQFSRDFKCAAQSKNHTKSQREMLRIRSA